MNIFRVVKCNIDSFLVASLLSVNALRVFMGITKTSVSLYLIYLMTILVLFTKYQRRIVKMLNSNIKVSYISFFIIYILLFSFLSLTWVVYEKAPMTFLKFVISLMIAYLCLFIPAKKISVIMYSFLIINTVYGIYCFLFPMRVVLLFDEGMNYLNVTLTLGASFTISLVGFALSIFKKEMLKCLIWSLLSTVLFISLTGFIARGAILIPPIVVFLLTPFMGKKRSLKTIFVVMILSLATIYLSQLYMNMVSDYGAHRMMKTFEDTENEDRWGIWEYSWQVMVNRKWFIIGGGIDAFRSVAYYPHNLFLQILGEFGLIPFISFVFLQLSIVNRFIKCSRIWDFPYRNMLFFVVACLIYYTMTFSKSFSFYDGFPVFIMMALSFSLLEESKSLLKGRNNLMF